MKVYKIFMYILNLYRYCHYQSCLLQW